MIGHDPQDPYADGSLDHFDGTGMTTEFDTPDGRKVHRHSALALALQAPYAGHTNTPSRTPLNAIPDKLLFAARSQHRELVKLLWRFVSAVDDTGLIVADDKAEALIAEARRVLWQHNRPHPSPMRPDA